MLLQQVKMVTVTQMSGSGVLASPRVISKQKRGRHGITIVGTGSGIYIGAEDGFDTSTEGLFLAEGQKLTIPVDTLTPDVLYYNGTGTLMEYFN